MAFLARILPTLILLCGIAAADGYLVHDNALYRVTGEGAVSMVALPAPAAALFGRDTARGRLLIGLGTRDIAPNSDELPGTNLAWIDENGAVLEQVTHHLSTLTATVSPDGESLAFTSRQGTLHIRSNRPAWRELDLVAINAWQPAWSPDGEEIAFVSMPPDPSHSDPDLGLRVYTVATGALRTVTQGYADVRPLWTPDGATLVFLSAARTGLASFYEVPAKGGKVTQLTNVGQTTITPAFVPVPNEDLFWEGQALVFSTRYGDDVSVWRLLRTAPGKAQAQRLVGAARAALVDGQTWALDDGGATLSAAKAVQP